MNTASYHLLVADGNKFNREILSARLAKQGYKVTTAEDGYLALGMLEVKAFDLVILDRDLPRGGGYDLLQRIKTHPDWCHVPVIVTLDKEDVESTARCIEAGAEDCLAKPINTILLLARVGASLVKKRLHDKELAFRQELSAKIEQIGRCVAEEAQPDLSTHSHILFALAKLVESHGVTRAVHLGGAAIR